MARQYVEAYRGYCWPVKSVADLKLAPFHLLASEGQVHIDKDHLWHMEMLAALAQNGTPLMATPYKMVDVTSTGSQADGIRWWEELTSRGGEGMVVKRWRLSCAAKGAGATGDQIAWAGVPADHLRTGIFCAAESGAVAQPRASGQALSGIARVRTRDRIARAVCPA